MDPTRELDGAAIEAAALRRLRAKSSKNSKRTAAPIAVTPPELPTGTDADGFIRVGILVAEPDNEHPWTVHGLIPSGGMALIAGKPKAGKSTLARAIALRVCRGESVLGRQTMAGAVLYLGLEDPREAIKGHFKRMGATDADDLHVYTGKVPEYAQAWLADQLAKRDPVLVVIDTMQFFLGISEINEYGQVVNALRSILDLFRGKRCAVLIVHHAGKGERVGFDAILGSTGILGTVDTAMLIKRRPDDQTRTIATMQRMHAPGGEDMPETVLTLDDTAEPQLAGTRADYDVQKVGQALKDYLATRGPDWVERADALGAVEAAGQLKVKALDALVRAGHAERSGEGKKGKPYLFRVAPGLANIPFFRSLHIPRTAERNPKTEDKADEIRPNAVLANSGFLPEPPSPQNGIAGLCPKGHRLVAGFCPSCEPLKFLAALDAEAAAAREAR